MNRLPDFNAVRKVLFEEWDPIEVNDNPNLADEYDDMVPIIVGLLQQRPTVAEVAGLLASFEQELGLTAPFTGEPKQRIRF